MKLKWIVIRTLLFVSIAACFGNLAGHYEFYETRSKLLDEKIRVLNTGEQAQYSDALETIDLRIAAHDALPPAFSGNIAIPGFLLLALLALGWWLERVERRELAADRPTGPLRVEGIDHAELNVPDRFKAAGWYNAMLGLNIMSEYEEWSKDPKGPLMISSDDGHTKLALFEGEQGGSRRASDFT